jgi:hypothetical protein
MTGFGVQYVMKREPAPSLCEHWMPDDGLHEMSNRCWCNPIIENFNGSGGGSIYGGDKARTTVRHRPHQQKGIA